MLDIRSFTEYNANNNANAAPLNRPSRLRRPRRFTSCGLRVAPSSNLFEVPNSKSELEAEGRSS